MRIECQNCQSDWDIEFLNSDVVSLMSLVSCPICVRIEKEEEEAREIKHRKPRAARRRGRPRSNTPPAKRGRKGGKWTDEMDEFIKKHAHQKNAILVKMLNKKFGMKFSQAAMTFRISNKKLRQKEEDDDDDEGLRKLPPENDF